MVPTHNQTINFLFLLQRRLNKRHTLLETVHRETDTEDVWGGGVEVCLVKAHIHKHTLHCMEKNMCHKLELSVLRGSYEMDGPLFWSRLKYFNSYKYDKNYFWCRCILFPKDTS